MHLVKSTLSAPLPRPRTVQLGVYSVPGPALHARDANQNEIPSFD